MKLGEFVNFTLRLMQRVLGLTRELGCCRVRQKGFEDEVSPEGLSFSICFGGELKVARLSWPSLAFLEVADAQPLGKRSLKKKNLKPLTLNPYKS